MEDSPELEALRTPDALHRKLSGKQLLSLVITTLIIPAIILVGVGMML